MVRPCTEAYDHGMGAASPEDRLLDREAELRAIAAAIKIGMRGHRVGTAGGERSRDWQEQASHRKVGQPGTHEIVGKYKSCGVAP